MTIRVRIQLFGTLSSWVKDYDHKKGLRVEVQDDATSEDLLNHLKIPLNHVGLITQKNQAMKIDDPLFDGMIISFFSLVSGG